MLKKASTFPILMNVAICTSRSCRALSFLNERDWKHVSSGVGLTLKSDHLPQMLFQILFLLLSHPKLSIYADHQLPLVCEMKATLSTLSKSKGRHGLTGLILNIYCVVVLTFSRGPSSSPARCKYDKANEGSSLTDTSRGLLWLGGNHLPDSDYNHRSLHD